MGMDGWTDGWNDKQKSSCVLQDFVPFGTAARKVDNNVKYRHAFVLIGALIRVEYDNFKFLFQKHLGAN